MDRPPSTPSRVQSRPYHGLSLMDERVRGRRGVAMRLRRLSANPLCEDCLAKGLSVAATVPDHITPIALGGSDIDDNIRCLCAPCHEVRTAEQFGFKRKPTIGLDGWPIET